MKQIIVFLALLAIVETLHAQEKKNIEITQDISEGPKPGTKKVRIVKKVNGKTNVTERIISDKDSDIEINMDDDTLINGKRKNIRVIVKDDSDFTWRKEDGNNSNNGQNRLSGMRGRSFNSTYFRMADGSHKEGNKFYNDLGERDIKMPTVRALNVFTNKPQSEILNISFFAENEGEVNISVIDLKGNILAKENLKSFKGDYLGQVALKENSKGVFFVIVSQGEDGQTRKVLIE